MPAALEGNGERTLDPAPGPPASSSTSADLSAKLRTARPIYPIDLSGALRLAGARDLDIAIARERIALAMAQLQGARVQWLPSFFVGPSWARHDGQIQDNAGNVFTTSRSSLFIGGTAAAGGPVYAPPPGGGTAPVSSFATVLRISDAIFAPLAARQLVDARRARLAVTTNDVLLELTEAYFDLQTAAGQVAIAREALGHADTLVDLTGTYARTGAGLEADYQRSLTERQRQRQNLAQAVGRWKVASAALVWRTRLDPRMVVAPIEPPESIVRIVPSSCPLDDLIVAGLQNRPELAEAQALVQATLTRLKQARLRPLIPSVALRISAGGFGGGRNEFFGDFGGRQDSDVNLYWELQNFGLGDRAVARARAAEQRVAVFEQMRTQDRVASEVAAAYEEAAAAEERLGAGQRAELAQAEPGQHPRGGRTAGGDAADRGLAAHSGAGPGEGKLPRGRIGLKPRPIPPLPGPRLAGKAARPIPIPAARACSLAGPGARLRRPGQSPRPCPAGLRRRWVAPVKPSRAARNPRDPAGLPTTQPPMCIPPGPHPGLASSAKLATLRIDVP